MELKSDDILNVDIGPFLLTSDLAILNLDNQLDIENALLSVEGNKISETTNSSKDTKNQDLKMSVTNVQSVTEATQESELERRRDINGNEESSEDENLYQLLDELELSDSDNETVGEENSSDLRERGPVSKRSTKRRNRTNYERVNRYDRSQFPPGSLEFWSISTVVQSKDTPIIADQSTFESNQSSFLNINENSLSSPTNEVVSSPVPVLYEDLRASAFGSPESGYASSITGSPPRASSAVVSNLDFIPETDDDRIIDLLVENTPEDCALAGHNVLRCETYSKDPKEKINEIKKFLEAPPDELKEPFDTCYVNKVCVPLVKDPQDTTTCSGTSSPRSKIVEIRQRIEYRIETRARATLRENLSVKEIYRAQRKIYQQIIDDYAEEKEVKIIKVVNEADGTSENRTNLHHAVINSDNAEILCLVEIQKQYNKPFSDINIRDKYGKTALDYAVQKKMPLVVNYLKENTACQSVNV